MIYSKNRTGGLVSFLAVVFLLVFPAGSSVGENSDAKSEPACKVEVELSTSVPHIELGRTWELYATVKNLSDKPIWVSDRYSLLVLPAAVRPAYDELVASQGGTLAEPTVNPVGADYVRIGAYENGMVFWRIRWGRKEEEKGSQSEKTPQGESLEETASGTSESQEAGGQAGGIAKKDKEEEESLITRSFKSFYRQAFVVKPGRYEARVVLHYWVEDPIPRGSHDATVAEGQTGDSEEVAQEEQEEDILAKWVALVVGDQNALGSSSRTIVATKEIDVGYSPLVAIVGGGIGGLLGFLLLFFSQQSSSYEDSDSRTTQSSPRSPRRQRAYFACQGVLAILLGIIVTILVSQVGETNFFIAVRINDLWGAITTGLVAELVGVKVIERVLGIHIRRGFQPEPAGAGESPPATPGDTIEEVGPPPEQAPGE